MPTQSSTPTDWAVDSQTQDLMDSVFALMGECQKSLDQIIDQSQPWLLCIDDDRDFSAALASRLRRYGIGVLNAFDGADGYRQAFLQPAAAIILDYNMPNGQGDYVLRRLQETPITKDIPVIVLTGNRDTTIRRTMLNLGASAFLFKPPQFEKLLEELARFVKLAPIDEPAPTP